MHISSIKTYKSDTLYYINIVFLVLLTVMLIVNQVLMGRIQVKVGITSRGLMERIISFSMLGNQVGNNVKLTGKLGEDAVKLVVLTGVPDKYGTSLGVSFDKVQGSMNIMKQYDPDSGTKAIILDGKKFERYKKIGLSISCEYCCGAKSIIQSSGRSACGCDHAKAMRGLMAYLLKNHDTQFSNDEILRELARWKGRYFPKQMIKKVVTQIQSGKYTHDTAALLLGVTLPKYSNASGDVPLPSSIKDLPGMVGGC